MGMVNSDSILTGINILLTIISGIGAYKSVKYFRKSRNLTIFAQTNKAFKHGYAWKKRNEFAK